MLEQAFQGISQCVATEAVERRKLDECTTRVASLETERKALAEQATQAAHTASFLGGPTKVVVSSVK